MSAQVVTPLIEGCHYLHRMPAAVCRCYGVYLDGDLVGAVVLAAGARMAHRALLAARPCHVVTLARLWLDDALPTNAESRVLAVVARLLRREGRWRLIVTHADPGAGHVGTIYRAAGWQWWGQAPPGRYLDLGDGRPRHPRSVFSAFGTTDLDRLRAQGVRARVRLVPGKHRYACLLDASWAWRLASHLEPG